MLRYFQFKSLRQSGGWMTPAYVGIDQKGVISYLSSEAPREISSIEQVHGIVLPGFQNAHSHAFQYAMAGMAEVHQPGASDDFWSWREAMYRCALRMEPDMMQAIAAQAYTEMLKKGYTHVAEFHYLHHDRNGKPYHHLAEMGERLVDAARIAGIKITLAPVFYQRGGFGKNYQPEQRRFISENVDAYFQLLSASAEVVRKNAHASLAFGVHSLRAVDANDVIQTYQQGPSDIPFHLHAAEQLKEVEDSMAYLGQRPIEWLLDHLPVNDRFNIVHCTHMTDDEIKRLAESNATAVLCPGTEGNLGDGIFSLSQFARYGGNWAIGTDSHISLNPLEDLRWLDYAQRFTTHKRNTFSDGASTLIHKTTFAGRKAMGNATTAFFQAGQPFDAVVYHADTPLLSNTSETNLLSGLVYTADSSATMGTIVNGNWIVKDHRHIHDHDIHVRFDDAMKAMLSY